MRTQVSNHLREKVTLEQKFRELTVWHHCLLGFTTWFFIFTFWGDVRLSYGSELAGVNKPYGLLQNLISYIFIIIFFAIGLVFPISFAGWGISQICDFHKNYWQRQSWFNRAIAFIGWIVCGVILVLCPLSFFLIFETAFPVSVAPFATVVTGTVWLAFGYAITHSLSFRMRLTTVSLMLLLILSVRYLDLTSKKSFLLDLQQIRSGMSGVQVEKILRDHRKNFVDPEEEQFLHLTPGFTGSTGFRARRTGDFARITFQDGKVTKVEFSGD